MKKRIIALTVVSVIAAAFVVQTTPASAAPFAGAAQCTINLPWPTPAGGGADDCNGTAVGSFVPGPQCVNCPFVGDVATYSEGCVAGEPPLTGTADGTIRVNGSNVADFEWTRVGATAVLVLSNGGSPSGAGVAAFIPLPPLPTCANQGRLTAQVVGLAINAI